MGTPRLRRESGHDCDPRHPRNRSRLNSPRTPVACDRYSSLNTQLWVKIKGGCFCDACWASSPTEYDTELAKQRGLSVQLALGEGTHFYLHLELFFPRPSLSTVPSAHLIRGGYIQKHPGLSEEPMGSDSFMMHPNWRGHSAETQTEGTHFGRRCAVTIRIRTLSSFLQDHLHQLSGLRHEPD